MCKMTAKQKLPLSFVYFVLYFALISEFINDQLCMYLCALPKQSVPIALTKTNIHSKICVE